MIEHGASGGIAMAAIDWDAAVSGLDQDDIGRLVTVIRHASGKRP